MINNASCWYEQLSEITKAMIDGQNLSSYQVFKFKFHQRFINTNDAEDAFNQIKNLQQKHSINEYVTLFTRYCSHLTDFTNKDTVHFFHSGLKPELHQLVKNHPDIAKDDINSLIMLAERLDKMNKSEHQCSHSYYTSNISSYTHVKEETFPQPMEIDSIFTHKHVLMKPSHSMSKEHHKKNDFEKSLCLYYHEPGHMTNTCPMCNKMSNSLAH